MRVSTIALFFLLLIFAFGGCSSINGSSNSMITTPYEDSTNTDVLYFGTLTINPDTMTIENHENRDADYVYNISGFLPNNCPGGCFRFRIVNVVGTVLEVELTLENPTSLLLYDVRVEYLNLFTKTLLNPDSYTDFLSAPNVPKPFTAFMKNDPNRAFPVGPGKVDKQTIFIDFPPGSNTAIYYAVTASFPNQTLEPFEINSMAQDGYLTPSGGNANISCYVLDHQGDIDKVYLDARVLTGGIVEMTPDVVTPNKYSYVISNDLGKPVGQYKMFIKALSSNPQNISTYNQVTVTVSPVLEEGLVAFTVGSVINTSKPDGTDRRSLGVTGYYPCISQNNNIIVYCSGYSGDLRAITTQGTLDRLILEGAFRYPTVSADGKIIAFYDNASPSKCYRININGSDLVQISPDDGANWRYANISGNGEKIVMERYEYPHDIYVCDSDGSNLTLVKSDAGYPSITYNADWIFYETPFQIRRIRPDGTDDQRVIGCSATSYYGITPDGTKVCFCQYYSGDGNDLGVYDLITGVEKRLTFVNRNAGQKTLSIDGRWIVADGFATGDMYSIKTDGSGDIIEWGSADNPSAHGSLGEHY